MVGCSFTNQVVLGSSPVAVTQKCMVQHVQKCMVQHVRGWVRANKRSFRKNQSLLELYSESRSVFF